MSEAVEAFIDDNDIIEAREILKVLYDNYLSDMELYQASQVESFLPYHFILFLLQQKISPMEICKYKEKNQLVTVCNQLISN